MPKLPDFAYQIAIVAVGVMVARYVIMWGYQAGIPLLSDIAPDLDS